MKKKKKKRKRKGGNGDPNWKRRKCYIHFSCPPILPAPHSAEGDMTPHTLQPSRQPLTPVAAFLFFVLPSSPSQAGACAVAEAGTCGCSGSENRPATARRASQKPATHAASLDLRRKASFSDHSRSAGPPVASMEGIERRLKVRKCTLCLSGMFCPSPSFDG